MMLDEKKGVTKDTFGSDDERRQQYIKDLLNDAEDLADQRDKANLDFRFIFATGGMWEDWLEADFSNRTKLEFDQVSDFVNRFLGEWDNNRMGVEYKPDDLKTSDKDAELLNGLYRADFRDESGKVALDNAVDETAICGYGALKIGTHFVDDEDPENEDQRIDFRPKTNAYNTVIWDRAATRIDKRDARRVVELEPYTLQSFKDEFGEDEENPVSAYEPHTHSFNDFTMKTKRTIYVATRYELVRRKEKFFIYGNLMTNEIESYSEEDHDLIKDELKKDRFRRLIRTRKIIRQSVEKSIFTGNKFIQKPKRIAGKFLPLIPFYGYRSYVDGVERYHGLVRKLMDPQRLFNMQMSQLAENSASSGQEVPIFDPDQMPDNIANLWANRNNKPYMLAKALTNPITGEIIQAGPIGTLRQSQLDPATAALLQIVPQHIQLVTGGAPQDTIDPNASGKAINAMRKRENLKTATIMDNIGNSIEWLGVVYQSIASEIYNSKRVMRTIGADGNQSQTMLFKEVMDEKTGVIVMANNLQGKKFKAYSDVGPQYDTLREQTVEDLKGMMELLITAGPAGAKYIPMLTSMMLENMTGVGLADFKETIRKDLLLQGIKKPDTDEDKEFVKRARLKAKEDDPQKQLMKAAADQAKSEGAKFRSEARNLDSKSISNIADARKKTAETRKILTEIGLNREGILKELLSSTLRRAEKLPFSGAVNLPGGLPASRRKPEPAGPSGLPPAPLLPPAGGTQ